MRHVALLAIQLSCIEVVESCYRSLFRFVLAKVTASVSLVLGCLRRRRLGPFQLQAAIQAMHCAAARYQDTDWAAVIRFYDRLITVMPTPVVALNRAIAVAETQGPGHGLLLVDELADQLAGYHPWHAARGSMLDRLGRRGEASEAYARAAGLARADAARRFLRRQSESAVGDMRR